MSVSHEAELRQWRAGERRRRLGVRVALVLLAAWQAVLLVTWLHKDRRPPVREAAVHLLTARGLARALAAGDVREALVARPRPGHPPYPPLAHLLMAPSMGAAEGVGVDPEDGAALTNLLAIWLLGGAAFVLARSWWGETAGLAAAFLTSLSPPVLLLSHQPQTDLLLAAWVMAAYAAWNHSEGFSRWPGSLALGGVAGLAMLTKWSFPIYILPILAGAVVRLVRQDPPDPGAPRRRWKVLAAAGISVVLAGPWYGINGEAVFPALWAAAGARVGEPVVGSWAGWVWYPKVIADQLTDPGVVVALAGAVWAFLKCPRSFYVLGAWIVSGLVLWSFVDNKDPRYILPTMLALPLAAVTLPSHLPKALAGLAVIFPAWAHWGPLGSPHTDPPVAEVWSLGEIFRTAAARPSAGTTEVEFVEVPVETELVNVETLAWILEREKMTGRFRLRGASERRDASARFVLRIRRGVPSTDESPISPRERTRWALPDGSLAVWEERVREPAVSPAAVSVQGGDVPLDPGAIPR